MTDSLRFIRELARLLPTFVLISVFGCIVALLFRVSVDDIGFVVGVPVLVGFILSRLAVLAVPRPQSAPRVSPNMRRVHSHPLPMRQLAFISGAATIALTLSALATAVFCPSAAIFRWLGMTHYAKIFAQIGLFSVSIAVLNLFILLVEDWANMAILRFVLRRTGREEASAFWAILRIPTRVATFVCTCFEQVENSVLHFRQ